MKSIKVVLKVLSPLTVGYVGKPVGPDIAFNELGIPPTTLKGVLRASLSRYLSEIDPGSGFSSCGEIEPERIRIAHEKMGRACDVCSLFGYPESRGSSWRPAESRGRVKLRWITDIGGELETMTRIAIDDLTGSVKENALFSQEYLAPGKELEFEAFIDGGCRELELFLISLEALRFYRVGRAGMVDLKVESPSDVERELSGCGSQEALHRLRRLSTYMWGE